MTPATVLLDVPTLLVVLFAVIFVPLALGLTHLPRLSRAALAAGALAAISLKLGPSHANAVLMVPYAIVCALAGLVGLRRLLAHWTDPAQLAMSFGLVGLAGACTWLVAYRAGYSLLGYPPFWVLLTAAHFHVAGTVLPIVIGWTVLPRGRLPRLVAVGCVVGVPLTAAGIYGPHVLEVAGALVMAASGVGAALVLMTSKGEHVLLRLAGVPLAGGMILAVLYALRAHGTAIRIGELDPLASMIVTHGVLDSLFGVLALVGIRRSVGVGLRVRDVPPLSRLRGAWPVGATYFQRTNIEQARTPAPTGLVDTIEDLDVRGDQIAPAIRAFYEHTGAHELVVVPRWSAGFRTGARVWRALAKRMGQLQLPVTAESGKEGIASRIVGLDETRDGRKAPRAWIRTYPDGRALYVAAYATHRDGAHAYMNIAFPLPGGQLSSLLRMVPRASGSVTVSTREGGDCGIWLVLWGLALRLPLSETIEVWTVDDASAPADLRAWAAGYSTLARHTLWLCGVHYLTLDYAMRPRRSISDEQ